MCQIPVDGDCENPDTQYNAFQTHDPFGGHVLDKRIDFQTDPSRYRYWRVEHDGPVANLYMDVDETGGLFDGYELKLNSHYRKM